MSVPTRTVLRVKRRRSATPAASIIRLDVLGGFQVHGGDYKEEEEEKQSHSAIWKLVSSSEKSKDAEELVNAAASTLDDPSCFSASKRCRVVDAVLDEQPEPVVQEDLMYPGEEEQQESRFKKRRRLTLVDRKESSVGKQTTKQADPVYRVLDPLSRLVDDSLQQAHCGDITTREHYDFLTTDHRLAMNARKWLLWNHKEHGNILHACAHWNDVELAFCLLQRPDLVNIAEQTDSDGKTPFEIAHLTGAGDIITALEAFGADTSNYVYDIFIHDPLDQYGHPINPAMDKNLQYEYHDPASYSQEGPIPFELKGGVGYWTPEGEYVLEVDQGKHGCGYGDPAYAEDDIDSNCEDYGGNDYPDEDDEFWQNDFYPGGGSGKLIGYDDTVEENDEPPFWG